VKILVLAVALLLVPTAAQALDPPDGNGPSVIMGTMGDDQGLYGGRGPDVIYGLAGDDHIWTGKGGPGDEVYGGPGDDRVNNWDSGSSPGLLVGGPGRDVCTGDPHDTFRGCEVVRYK
jgi:Ca2+-binding RTX toxin-like protein